MSGTNKELPVLVSYKDWIQNTALTFHVRSKQLKSLDAALLKYDQSRSAEALDGVQKSFTEWKVSKGSGYEWKSSSRNKNKLVTLLDQQLRGVGDTDVALGAQAFMEKDLINSRLGVLYLFSNIRCDSSFKVLIEGAIDLGAGAMDSFGVAAETLGKDHLKNGLDVTKSVLDKGKTPSGNLAQAIETRLGANTGPKTYASEQLLSATVIPPKDSKLRIIWEKIVAALHSCGEKILALINEKLSQARKKINEIRSDPGAAALQYLPKILRKLIDFLAATCLKAAAPFIGAGLDIAKGIANTIDAGITKFKEWLAGRNVELLFGHPSTIVEAIRKAMWFSIGSGLYDVLKGGVKLGLEFASSGVSTLASVIVSAVETLVKMIWKLVEIFRMNSFFGEAKEFWQARNEPSSIHNRPIAFNIWFRSYAVDLPAVSVLALNSGICGDKMRFLKMYKADDTIISQKDFDAGCRYVDSLKVWGSGYLEDTGFCFNSDDQVVNGLLKLARSHTEQKGLAEKGFCAVKDFLNA